MKELLKGKVAVVTGGTRGIGYGVACRFLEEGATVVICGSREETARRALADLQENYPEAEIGALWVDLSEEEAVAASFNRVVEKYGRLDILVNNAGIMQTTKLYDYSPKEYDDIMNLNVKALFVCTKVAASIMRRNGGGSVINTSSIVSLYGQSVGVMYPASKFAVNGITKSLARELGKDGIRVNAVAPGVVKTDMVASLPESLISPVVAKIPLGRMAEVREIADAFLYLASDMSSYVTGAVLSVDGGEVN